MVLKLLSDESVDQILEDLFTDKVIEVCNYDVDMDFNVKGYFDHKVIVLGEVFVFVEEVVGNVEDLL